jgi:hypothetical protein
MLSGCVGSFRVVPGDTSQTYSPRCAQLDTAHRTGNTTAIVLTGSATALGATAGFEAKDNTNAAKWLALSSGLVAAVGTGALWYSQSAFDSYQQLCVQGKK